MVRIIPKPRAAHMKTIQGDGFIVTVIKSKRKTTALKIRDGEVSIHIPMRLPMQFAQDFVSQKTAWITSKLAEQRHQQREEKQFVEGEIFSFLGKPYILHLIQDNAASRINKTATQLELRGRVNRLSTNGIQKALTQWYKQQATLYISSRTAELAEETQLTPHDVAIKTYKARWGSCSIHGQINFNWKLILAPANIIDYVIIHELCHLQHHNHSRDFWNLVEAFEPNYKTARLWLKKHGMSLDLV